jgi:hypothetical protein
VITFLLTSELVSLPIYLCYKYTQSPMGLTISPGPPESSTLILKTLLDGEIGAVKSVCSRGVDEVRFLCLFFTSLTNKLSVLKRVVRMVA